MKEREMKELIDQIVIGHFHFFLTFFVLYLFGLVMNAVRCTISGNMSLLNTVISVTKEGQH